MTSEFSDLGSILQEIERADIKGGPTLVVHHLLAAQGLVASALFHISRLHETATLLYRIPMESELEFHLRSRMKMLADTAFWQSILSYAGSDRGGADGMILLPEEQRHLDADVRAVFEECKFFGVHAVSFTWLRRGDDIFVHALAGGLQYSGVARANDFAIERMSALAIEREATLMCDPVSL